MAAVPDWRGVSSGWPLTWLLLSLFEAVDAHSAGVAVWLAAATSLDKWVGWKEVALGMGSGLAVSASMPALRRGLKGITWRTVDTGPSW